MTKKLTSQQEIDQMLAQQRQIIAKQDAQLVIISQGVDRLKNHAYNIGDELDKQNKMLDEMDYEVSKLSVKLQKTTKDVEKIGKPLPIMEWIFGPWARIFA